MAAPAPITVSVPAHAESLHVLRAVAASVAARLDLPFDAVDEIRIAVDEAATLLLEGGTTATELSLEIEAAGSEFAATLSIDAHVDQWPPPGAEQSWSWRVLRGLCDQATFLRPDGRPGIALRRRRSVTSDR